MVGEEVGMKITITAIRKIEDQVGKFGPQKRIEFTDENGRNISGWVSEKAFRSEEWVVGKSIDAEVYQNGKYWNFKLLTKQAAAQAESKEEILNALRSMYVRINERFNALEKRLDVLQSKNSLTPMGDESFDFGNNVSPFED